MFVKVTKNGRDIHKVSKTVFEKKLKKAGYRMMEQKEKAKEEHPVEEESMDEAEMEEEISVSDMTKEQLAQFAKEHNIDTSHASNVRQARAIINAAISKERK